ncbi:MAG: cupin domain-containing protein [Colwellia sp.]|nr:cupin domain-containing protein [Colwellia sp.]
MSEKKIIRLNSTPKGFGKVADELKSDMFESALPTQHTHSYYEDDELGLYIGVWDTTDMVESAAPYACDEFMVLLEGQATIKNIKTGQLETVNAGDTFIIPKGYDCQWQQTGYLRKFYLISEHPDEIAPVVPTFEGIINISEVHRSSSKNSIAVKASAIPNTSFVMKSGKPVKKGQHLYQDDTGNFFSGIWQSQHFETEQQAFPRNEFIYIQSGELECIDEDNQSHKFIQGDALFIPKGTLCHWRVAESVATFYAVLQSDN